MDKGQKMQLGPASQPLLSSQETIEYYKEENLKLKVLLHQLKQENQGDNLDETKRDLITSLICQNDELREQLDELRRKEESIIERPPLKDASCQTHLDRYNIDELIEASVTLKRQKRMEQKGHMQETFRHQTPLPNKQLPLNKHYHHHHIQQVHQTTQTHAVQTQPKVSQLHYPHVTLPRQTSSTKQMTPDEKELLELLYRIDGNMTTAVDKLRAVSDAQEH